MLLVSKQVYDLEAHDRGTTFEHFLSCVKPYLAASELMKISDPKVSQITIDYIVETPTEDVLWEMAFKRYRREDGQWYYKGDPTPSEVILEKMREVVRILIVKINVKV